MGEAWRSKIERDSDNYFDRNRLQLVRGNDPVLAAAMQLHWERPLRSVAEIGCADGWRLKSLQEQTGCRCSGLEASVRAVAAATDSIQIIQGVAPFDLPHLSQLSTDGRFDLIILGFIAYLMPREELFNLAAGIDNLLQEEGHLIVFDFLYPRNVSRTYKHSGGLRVYKSDPSAPWTWNPLYSLTQRNLWVDDESEFEPHDPEGWVTVDVLRKNMPSIAYPSAGCDRD